MKIRHEGKTLSLGKADFVAQGGEASIYAREGVAFKIYHEAQSTISSDKIAELQGIVSPVVIGPEAQIRDESGTVVGYSMRHLVDCYTLCQLFPKAFRQRHSLSQETSHALVLQIREGIEDVHRAGVLLVDGNEMNVLVRSDFAQVFFVDVDSYQTPQFPATAIMQSISDPLVRGRCFTQGSDWFSFAVLAFQLLIGIHPDKGRHSTVKGLANRMSAGISVFNSEVRLPKAIGDIQLIPANYLQWFRDVFEGGVRTVPPDTFSATRELRIPSRVRDSAKGLTFELLETISERYIGSWERNGQRLSASSQSVWKGGEILEETGEGFEGIVFDDGGRSYRVNLVKGEVCFAMLGSEVKLQWAGYVSSLSIGEGCLYAHSVHRVFELRIVGAIPMVSSEVVTNVLRHATQLFPGVVLQKLLGTAYVSLLSEPGKSYQIALPELSDILVVDAQLRSRVLVLSGYRDSLLCRFVFRFSTDFTSYDLRVDEDIDIATVNFAVLDSGVCVLAVGDEVLELFSECPSSARIDRLHGTGISLDMELSSRSSELVVTSENRLMKVSMA